MTVPDPPPLTLKPGSRDAIAANQRVLADTMNLLSDRQLFITQGLEVLATTTSEATRSQQAQIDQLVETVRQLHAVNRTLYRLVTLCVTGKATELDLASASVT